MIQKLMLSLVMAYLVPVAAFAIPLPKGPRSLMTPPSTYSENYNFEGIVGLSNCSGSIVRLENSKDTDMALVLTNGHCNEDGMPDPGQVIVDRANSRRFNVLDPSGRTLGRINATRMLFSTMTKTDMALYRVDKTYAQILEQFNVRPFTLSSQHPQIHQPIEVVSGYWKMGYTCMIEQFVHELDEAGYKWFDSIRYSRPGCEVIGGTSGSPIIAAGSRTVIGVNNTGNEDGERCTMNNPCEVDDKGAVTVGKGFSYGQQTYWLYSCLNAQNEFDLQRPGCMLPH